MDCAASHESEHSVVSLIHPCPYVSSQMWRASATNENTQGAIQSFVIKQDGSLSEVIATTSSGGNGPAFAIPLSTGEVAAMNVRYFLRLPLIPTLNIYTYVTYSLAREMAYLSPPKKTRCSLCRARHSSRSPRRVSRTHTWRWRSGRRSSFRTWYVHAALWLLSRRASMVSEPSPSSLFRSRHTGR